MSQGPFVRRVTAVKNIACRALLGPRQPTDHLGVFRACLSGTTQLRRDTRPAVQGFGSSNPFWDATNSHAPLAAPNSKAVFRQLCCDRLVFCFSFWFNWSVGARLSALVDYFKQLLVINAVGMRITLWGGSYKLL